MTINTSFPSRITNPVDDLINRLCPTFGDKASDIPIFDSNRNAWLVNQYLSHRGNRTLTYVAVCDKLAVEFVTGQHYSMEYINSLRILIPDGFSFKIVQTYKWEDKTHFSNIELQNRTRDALVSFFSQNAHDIPVNDTDIEDAARRMVETVFNTGASYADGNGRSVLEAYCSSAKVCNDFSCNMIPEIE